MTTEDLVRYGHDIENRVMVCGSKTIVFR